MKKTMNYPIEFKEFKVRKHWWMWAIAVFVHILAIRFWVIGIYHVMVVLWIADLFILSDAAHFRYVLNDKFLEVRRIVYPGTDILLSSIISVQSATLFTLPGFGLKINEDSMGAYKINYMEGKKEKAIIITPKKGNEFIGELSSRLVDKNVVLLDNRESAFKKKKDQR